MELDLIYTIPEAAKILKTNVNFVYELIKAGHLKTLKIGRLKIRRITLEKFIEEHEGFDLTDPFNIKKLEN
ncbi:MAG: helix-turn-helix domain-containing protein [Clostridia bacterium]|nr:helix-turn-helix domain-containing protein [Clostridia bacterium]